MYREHCAAVFHKIDAVSHLNGVYHILFGVGDRFFLTDTQKDQLEEHLPKMAKHHLISMGEACLLGPKQVAGEA